MIVDREKVIKAIEICYTSGHNCTECPFFSEDDCNDKSMHDALALLKEHEAKQVKLYGKEEWVGFSCVCPDCKARWMGSRSETHFCPNCGRQVKWND